MIECTETNPRVLYEAHSIVRGHKNLGDMMITCYLHCCTAPVSPYEELINGYPIIDQETRRRQQGFPI